ncbi:MAG: L-histidine N(alpha)-methyltransferase [Pseudomonadota bacterium]
MTNSNAASGDDASRSSLAMAPISKGTFYAPHPPLSFFLDLDPPLSDFRQDALEGLGKKQKQLSPMYFYDERGSQLFTQITKLDEYYVPRVEASIFDFHKDELREAINAHQAVFEYGSGSSTKIKKLLSIMPDPAGYVAMDISRDFLLENAGYLANDIDLPVGAVCADFNSAISLPRVGDFKDPTWLGFFPGSTIGNLSREDVVRLLRMADETLGDDAQFIVGVDLEKDASVLRSAYNDPHGVTAAFNLNLLERLQRELNADVRPDDFRHEIVVTNAPQTVEMHLVAQRKTDIKIGANTFEFAAGESLHTENSHKYSLSRLDEILTQTPWRRTATFTDPNNWFAICLLSNN